MGAGEMKEYVKLSEVCNIIMGQSPESNSYNELGNGLPFFQGNADFGELYPVTKMWCTEPKKIVEKNTLLISVRAPIGALNFSTERCCIGRGLAGITAKAPTDLKYIYYGLMNKKEELNRLGTGSTFKAINKKVLKNTLIVKEKAERQHNIVKVLDKNILIIAHLQKQLYLLDELVKSRFVEMFGDPVCNSMNLPTMKGIDIFRLTNGKFVPESKRYELGIPAYGGNGISWYTDAALIQKDTIVIGRVGFQSGNVHFAKGPLWITDNAMYINNFNAEKYDLFFMYYLMRYIDFTRFQDAGDLKKITQKPFMNMKYIMPVLSRQREYVAFVKQTDKSRLLFKCQLLQYHSIEHIIRGRNYG